ncbi:MAG: hybrid sensor histidine kinase/response regulator [Anaerolineae bacterium]|nr:hybrid sensor histidine kinase/response regulator [Anaerolineae bacterium]
MTTVEPKSPEPTPSTVLIVDDNPTNVGVLLDYLSNAGYRVLVAQNGESALERVAFARPDIILLDVLMPGIDGFETCRRLKANPDSQDIPIIFMTALAETVDKVKGFSIGAVDYVTKPIQHEEVLARLTAHVTIKNLQQQLQAKNENLQAEISERKRAQAEQAHLIAELDAFAHTVAHDLKNPLTSIMVNAEVLLDDWPSAEDKAKATQAIDRGTQRMETIITELLTLARVRKTEVKLQPVNMTTIAQNVCQRLELSIKEAQAEIIHPDTWPTALGHAPWLEEVWANLLENALKYGGHPPRIECGATPEANNQIRFWIKDNGTGLSAEAQAKLFQPFTQLKTSSTEGYGLGLSIVQRIIEKLGGQVGVESAGVPGQGCVFSFVLPAG